MSITSLAFFTISSQKVKADVIDIYKNGLFDTEVYTSNSELLTDNDLLTFWRPMKDGSVILTFEEPQDINHIYLNSSRGGLLRFYDSSDVLITSMNTSSFKLENNYLIDMSIHNVKKVNVFQPNDISPRSEFMEIEVFSSLPDSFPPSKISNVQYVFNEDNSITYTFDFPTDSDFSHLEIYQGSSLLNEKFTNNSIKITDLVPLMNYTFKFISVDKSGNKSEAYESIITMPEGPDLIAPLDVTNLKHVVSDSSVQFTYSLPIDDDFSHLQIYRGNDLIADNVKIASFTDENLDFETSYKYTFKSVDFTGNISNGSTLTIKTMPYNDEIAPSAPSGLVVNTGNSSLYFNWLGNSENDLAGYNVYVDGIKKNGALVNSVSYRLTNLVNNQEYTIQVSAVDTSGNESVLSDFVLGVPDVSKLPIFKVDNDLKPVAESIESWFSALWLPIAFSSGITLAFIVGRRIKALFFA